MSNFARVEVNIVVQVLHVVTDDHEAELLNGQQWVQTSYNTWHGIHTSGGTPLRKNYAQIGDTYDEQRDAFIPRQPFSSWQLDEDTCQWIPPVARPIDGNMYVWDEESLMWQILVIK